MAKGDAKKKFGGLFWVVTGAVILVIVYFFVAASGLFPALDVRRDIADELLETENALSDAIKEKELLEGELTALEDGVNPTILWIGVAATAGLLFVALTKKPLGEGVGVPNWLVAEKICTAEARLLGWDHVSKAGMSHGRWYNEVTRRTLKLGVGAFEYWYAFAFSQVHERGVIPPGLTVCVAVYKLDRDRTFLVEGVDLDDFFSLLKEQGDKVHSESQSYLKGVQDTVQTIRPDINQREVEL